MSQVALDPFDLVELDAVVLTLHVGHLQELRCGVCLLHLQLLHAAQTHLLKQKPTRKNLRTL